MSSSAIMALIRQKEAELKQLRGTKAQVDKVYGSVDCMASKYISASRLINESGSIGGRSFDNGATATVGKNLSDISNSAYAASKEVAGSISSLESEISGLYAAYNEALAREAEEERRRRRR